MIETLTASPEFEQNQHREIERKFLAFFPEQLADLREQSHPIEQFYLSHPSEDFSLRFRAAWTDDEVIHTATLKDRGSITENGLERMEVEVEISKELYDSYHNEQTPLLRKLRAHANNSVSVDFFEDGHTQVESENPIALTHFLDRFGGDFVEITGDRMADNEWRAHLGHRRNNEGREALVPLPDLDIDQITADILANLSNQPKKIVQITGRSGSGKSTIVRQLQDSLNQCGLSSDVLSTDDYHRGNSWLTKHNNGQPWTQWDHPIVYDTEEMAADIRSLQGGRPITRYQINFETVERDVKGVVEPVDVLIVEGIYAASLDIAQLGMRYDMPTPVATCLGRRLRRDMIERPEFSDPTKSLRYMLEQAEPMWQQQSHNG